MIIDTEEYETFSRRRDLYGAIADSLKDVEEMVRELKDTSIDVEFIHDIREYTENHVEACNIILDHIMTKERQQSGHGTPFHD
jgi:ATP-dependent protease HslVU (ClpYQ) ATPase subunit